MKIAKPKLIFDPYQWLPGYGESKVSFSSDGTKVILEVEYEKEMSQFEKTVCKLHMRKIVFDYSPIFFKMPFPGDILFDFVGKSDKFTLGKMTEFEESDLVKNYIKARRTLSSQNPPILRHFSIQFLSENISFHVLAEEVYLSDEIPFNLP